MQLDKFISVQKDVFTLGYKFAILSRVSSPKKLVFEVPGIGDFTIRRSNSDAKTCRSIFRDKEYDFTHKLRRDQVNAAYDAIVASGKTPLIIDGGANVGAASRWFAAKFPKAAIVALEPEDVTFALLSENVSRFPNISARKVALGGKLGFVTVTSGEEAWATQTTRADQGLEVVTIPQIVLSVPNSELFIAKIDIEGFESDLFSGDLSWMDDTKVIILEPHDWMFPQRGTSRSFQKAFAARNFDLLVQRECLFYFRA